MIIDISYHQRPESIDYDKIASQIDGAILRAAYGTGAPGKFEGADPAFQTHYDELHKRGVPLGVYHYITEYQDIDAQAKLFLDTVRGKEMKLGYWCDVEVEKNADKLTVRSVIRWMELVEAELGECGIYVGFYGWHDIMGAEAHRYADRKLWLAAYVKDPMDYIPGDWLTYDLWQYTSTGKLDGYVAWDKELQKYVLGNLDMSKRGQMYPNKLVYPVDPATRISQKFGERPSTYPTSKGHNGVDWDCAVGTPIYAMQDGVVIRAADFSQPGITDGKVGYGRHVRIQHPEGISIYGHFSRLMVKEGDSVKAGQQIGLSGGATTDPNSGMSTGPHLHAEYRLTSGAPQVPGGYAYGAIDILPLLTGAFTPPEPETVLYRVKVIIPNASTPDSLIIRREPIREKQYDTGGRAKYPQEYDVFEEKNGYGRIGAGRWIALEYTQKLGTLTLEERVTALEKAVFGD